MNAEPLDDDFKDPTHPLRLVFVVAAGVGADSGHGAASAVADVV